MLLLACLPLIQPSRAWPATRSGPKALQFYFHYGSSAQTVAGVSTNYIANTLATFQNVKNHDSKASGQPKVQVDFYLYPPFAGQVRLSGEWQVIVFANSSALHPAIWNLEFWEKSSSGSIVWDSGAITPTVLGGPSGNNGYIDVPIYGYTLTTTNMTHAFQIANTLEVEISINTGSTVPLSVWYDSSHEPSRMILPSNDYMLISGISTKDANGTLRTVFFTFWSAAQRSVTVGTLSTDPFGGYDISSELVSIRGPTGSYAVTNQTMQKTSGTMQSFGSSFSYNFQYDSTAPRGNYTVTVLALDNNAVNQLASTASYYPFAQLASLVFSIGLQYPVHVRVMDAHGAALQGARVGFFSGQIEYASGLTSTNGTYGVSLFTGDFTVRVWWESVPVLSQNVTVKGITSLNLTTAVFYPTFRFVTDVKTPLAGALVFLRFPNGSATLLPYTTDSQGSFSLKQQPQGNYSMLVLFQGVNVAETAVGVSSDGPFVLTTKVFLLTVIVKDGGGSPLNGSSVLVSSPGRANGGADGYLLTGTKGEANFSLAEGSYTVTAEYHGVYFLSPITSTTGVQVTLNTDRSLVMTMKNLPPPFWLTLGFQLLIAAIVIILAIFLLFRRRD